MAFSRRIYISLIFSVFQGQWAPIVGTGLAVLGSLSLLLAASPDHGKDDENKKGTEKDRQGQNPPDHRCDCHMRQVDPSLVTASSPFAVTLDPTEMNPNPTNSDRGTIREKLPSRTQSSPVHSTQLKPSEPADEGSRRKVAKVLTSFANYVGTAAQDRFDVSDFKGGKALDFPELPGEAQRNPDLSQIREQYNHYNPALGRTTSKAGSFTSRLSFEGSAAATPRTGSPQPRSASTFPSSPRPQRPHITPLPAERSSLELRNTASSSSAGSPGGRTRHRRNTLEVPSPVHYNTTWSNDSPSSIIMVLERQISPTIVVSSEPDMESPAQSQMSEEPASPSSLPETPTHTEAALPPSS